VQLLDELEKVPSSSDEAKAVKSRGLLPRVMKGFVFAKQAGRFETMIHLRRTEVVESVQSETSRLIAPIGNREAPLTAGDLGKKAWRRSVERSGDGRVSSMT